MRLHLFHYCLNLLDSAAFILQALFDTLLADPVPYLSLHTTVILMSDALRVFAGLDVLMHRVISSWRDLPLTELDATATILQAKGTKIATTTSVRAIDSVAPVPISKGHLAAWASHREDVVDDVLRRLVDFNALRLHLPDGCGDLALHFRISLARELRFHQLGISPPSTQHQERYFGWLFDELLRREYHAYRLRKGFQGVHS